MTAVQRWDASKREIENGIFFGHLASLTFKGPYSFEGVSLLSGRWHGAVKPEICRPND